ncbi:hypothetical protein A3I99_04330 [Candidatus Kaiserbacteria bacterium RIFCSPLOWO2_02_FULL_45_11b]|uniref:Inositol-phosphate phosphatase n=1 Tax=Candidatus Kaiserbacteria bacterium RIFCSPLOWO2_12_FULL_45_26 TaxID=1798525 RepID=A0A1F6FHE9_9BACT|nr:MAG: hypothetical protein A2Z56_01210 [Candidatus Kaiserbacteria bacterium RIFCSPHIGHO2_12_45_16]OGG70134.1 MAG: hypothetical protein A2929_03545 [Candidatus Kaiserbacteria bacterium RIFCSPLOWO2_01_FULL_45_25]OGG83807.1 MAG: hypothetical protein A3I99_04330 [Candidatus Kaiserbacteria bacterium RIFCSPLOWO2_02_FULL_45_11b]OGG85305.1 MAG: hypothetical protein A3G90_04605 [Candidatus Kaiserbacteria bacterium RIFCSPLOWO2_12_FULL_45_26]
MLNYMKEFLSKTIQEAGAIVMDYYGKANVLMSKERVVDIVTEADLASDKFIVEAIKRNYPEHGIVTEESGLYNTDAEFVWYVDPLDGTKNFESSVPLFGINIALIQSGDIVLAGIYLPATRELIIAEKGMGASLSLDGHERKITCSQKQDWTGAYGIGPIRYSKENSDLQQTLASLSNNTTWISAIASPAVSAVWVADGRRDWYTSPGSNSWDFAAPVLIAKEAGCIVSNFEGKNWSPGDRGVIVTNNYLYPELAQAVTTAYFS